MRQVEISSAGCYYRVKKRQEDTALNIALITGASSGLGKEFFLKLENKYDEVWLIARRRERM